MSASMIGSTRLLFVRLLAALAMLFALASSAHADDVSASGRGVVRIITIAVIDGEPTSFRHGSGFAVAPNRIVTNAHVVEAASRYPGNVLIGIVPSEGDKAYQGRLIAIDPARDLALIEFSGLRLPPLTLFGGGIDEGEAMVALGYPGNVDLATARSAADYITPLSPVRSAGVFSGRRQLDGTEVLLHTASIARGNSGGPLLDSCGRVLGVNSAITRADEGDSGFAIAVAATEVQAFLREAKQPFNMLSNPCVSIEEALDQQRAADARDASSEAERLRTVSQRDEAKAQATIAEARTRNTLSRENYMAGAALLLALGTIILNLAVSLVAGGRWGFAVPVGMIGGGVIVAAAVVFFSRPDVEPPPETKTDVPSAALRSALSGQLGCTVQRERSRITVSKVEDVSIEWRGDGCLNGRTQYAEGDHGWQRVLVPDTEQTVSVLSFDPASGSYIDERYLLGAADMTAARKRRAGIAPAACTTDGAALTKLTAGQAAIRQSLPALPNERIVYRCTPAGDPPK